ncbi:unnamed protein product [Urochloa decumbens]|uniref:C2H2-type domain-containing protein n=1 Tax=Urochloa decumbens TaxID=240449 RepID=A0ABC8YSR6_9POAL
MARSSQDRLQIRRRLADPYGGEPEEGELVLPAAGYHSDADTEEYYNSNAACPSDDSEETISDSAPANYRRASPSPSPSPAAPRNKGGASTATSAAATAAGASSSAAAAAAVLACPFCGKGFRNHKAVCGHMKVHREQGGIGKVSKGKGTKRKAAAAVGGWGGTGKRGCSGSRSRAASPESMAIVVQEPKIVFNPMPLAFAAPNLSPPVPMVAPATPKKSSSSSVPVASVMTSDSVESSSAPPMRDDAMDTVVEEAAANPTTEAAVHHKASPPPPPPAAAATEEQAPPVPQQQPVAPPPPGGRHDPKGYTCKRCGMWFRTHQGLGGHIVGHKNRELAVAAALDGGAARGGGGGRDAKAAGKAHACKVCGKEFAGGLQLGGHMRKHWAGEPFNKKPRRAVLPLALALSSVRAGEASSPAPRPAVPGRVLLFGIDIGAAAKTTPAAEQGSPATEATAAPSTGGEQ